MRAPWIVPSVLNADPGRLYDEVARLDAAGVDAIQWDVMDGHFVPNLTFGPEFIKACRGARAGVALNPHTPLEAIRNVMASIDHLLIMTVNPGFGGQAYIAEMEPKIAEARALIDATGRDIPLEVDGGISSATIGP